MFPTTVPWAHELGPGVTLELVAHGGHVGFVVCRAMLELAARACPTMQRIQADMREVEFPAAHFDAICLIYSLFHLPWSEHPALFAHLRDWLKPQGRLLFTYATADYTGQERFEGDKIFMDQRLFYSHTTPEELGAQLANAFSGSRRVGPMRIESRSDEARRRVASRICRASNGADQ